MNFSVRSSLIQFIDMAINKFQLNIHTVLKVNYQKCVGGGVGANEVGMRTCGDIPKELGGRKWERQKMEAIIILH